MINKRTFHTQACHFTDKNDKVGNFLESQAKIQDQDQQKGLERIKDYRTQHGKLELTQLMNQDARLSKIDEKFINPLIEKRDSDVRTIGQQVHDAVKSSSISEESHGKIHEIEEKFDKHYDLLMQKIQEGSNNFESSENIKLQDNIRQLNESLLDESKKTLKVLEADTSTTESRSLLYKNIDDQLMKAIEHNDRVSRNSMKMQVELEESFHNINKCKEKYDITKTPDVSTPKSEPDTRSLIDDFADVNSEMPSYIDPED